MTCRRQRRLARYLATVLAVASLASACGSSSNPSATGGADASAAADADPNATLRIGMSMASAGGTFSDPAQFNGNGAGNTPHQMLIFDSMIHETAEGLKPGLATDVKAVDDQTLELTLRDGVSFQDGTTFDANAVKTSWDRIIASTTMVKTAELKALESVEVLAPNKVRVHLSAPQAAGWMLRFLRDATPLGVSSPAALQAQGATYDRPVGAGPYKLVEYDPNQKVILEKFDGYWDAASYKIKRIEIINTDAGAPQVTALASKTVDMAIVTPATAAAAEQQGFTVQETPQNGAAFLRFCTSKPPFDTPEAREAVAFALDRDAIAATQSGFGSVQTLPINSGAAAEWKQYRAEDLADSDAFDLTKAKQLATKGGITPGTKVTMLYPVGPEPQAAAEEIQLELKEIGVDVSLQQTTNQVQDLAKLSPELYLSSALDPRFLISAFLPGPIDLCNFDDPKVHEPFVRTRSALSTPDQVTQAWKEFQEGLLDVKPGTFLYATPVLVATSNKVKGLNYVYIGQVPDLRNVIVTK